MSIGFAIIGLGFRAEKHAEAISKVDGCSLKAVCSRKLKRAEEFASRHGSPKCYDEVEYLLEDPDVDIVAITTPTMNHLEPALLAIRSGRSVIVETPIEISAERAERLLRAAEEEGVFISFASDIPYSDIIKLRAEKRERLEICMRRYHPASYYEASSWKNRNIMMGEGYSALIYLMMLSGENAKYSISEEDGRHVCSALQEDGRTAVLYASAEKGNILEFLMDGKSVKAYDSFSLVGFYREFLDEVEKGIESKISPELFIQALKLIEQRL